MINRLPSTIPDISVNVKDTPTTNITCYNIVLEGGTIARLDEILTRALKNSRVIPLADIRNTHLKLSQHLPILLEWDGYQYIASSIDLETYGSGETEWEAIDDFRKEVVKLYNDLKSNQENLGPNLEKIWQYLKSIVVENEN